MKRPKGKAIPVPVQVLPARVSSAQTDAQARLAVQQNFDHLDGQLTLFKDVFEALLAEPELDDPEPEDTVTLTLKFFIRKRKHRIRYQCRVKADWSGLASNEDVDRVVFQMYYCDIAGTPVELDDDAKPHIYRRVKELPDEGDPNDKIAVVFRNLEKPKRWYVTFRARLKHKRGPLGPWTSWTTPKRPYDEVTAPSPGDVTNLQVKHNVPRRWKWTWDEPVDANDDHIVDRYRCRVFRKDGPSTWTQVEEGWTRGQHYAYRAPVADKDKRHKLRVKAFNEFDNEGNDVEDAADGSQNTDLNVADDIADGAITDLTPFASSIRPVEVVSSLPSLPDSNYPAGSYVFLTSSNRLYETKNGTSWTEAVTFVNLSGQIASSQIAAGTITGGHIVANSISSPHLLADSVTAGKIATGAVSADEIAANAITATHIHATGALIAKYFTTNSGSDSNYVVIDGATPSGRDHVEFWSSGASTVIAAQGGGIKFGGAAGALLGFYGHAPASRPSVTAGFGTSGVDFDGVARGAINNIVNALKSIGLFG